MLYKTSVFLFCTQNFFSPTMCVLLSHSLLLVQTIIRKRSMTDHVIYFKYIVLQVKLLADCIVVEKLIFI